MKPDSSQAKRDKLAESRPPRGKPGRYALLSLVLHAVLAIVLVFSWAWSEPVKAPVVPKHMPARMLSPDELATLKQRALQVQQREQALKQKKREEQKRQQQKKQQQQLRKKRELERKNKARKAAEAKKKADAKRKAEAKKKAAIAKKKAEEKRKTEAKRKAEAERKKAEAKKAAEKKAQEQKVAEQRAKERAREQKRKERERKLAERLAKAQEAASSRGLSAAQLSESEKYAGLIKGRIESRWHIPPKSDNLTVVLRIRLLPSGDLSGVEVIETSGNKAFDQSALTAVRAVPNFPVPADPQLFEENFRSFTAPFSPRR